MGKAARNLKPNDEEAIATVMTGMMQRAHLAPENDHTPQPYQGECDSCRTLNLALRVWLREHSVEEQQ